MCERVNMFNETLETQDESFKVTLALVTDKNVVTESEIPRDLKLILNIASGGEALLTQETDTDRLFRQRRSSPSRPRG